MMRSTHQTLSVVDDKIYALLQLAERPLSAYEILDKLRKKGVRSPPTVYRALEKLQESGLVHRVESLGAFVACRHACAEHHGAVCPLVICATCGEVRELCDPVLARAIKKVGTDFLAQVDHKVLEITGICYKCQMQNVPEESAHV